MNTPPDAPSSSQVDLRGGPRKRSLIVGVVGALAVAGVLTGILAFGGEDAGEEEGAAPPEADAGFDYGEYAAQVKNLRTIQKHKPCDKKNAIELGETLSRAGDHEGAIALVDRYGEECGVDRRVLWIKVGANEDLERWDEVVAVTTQLVEGNPHDSDYWWWRGRAHENLEETRAASADYRHSVARGPNRYGSSRLARMLREEDPCEGAFALHSYVWRRGGSAEWARRDFQELYLKGNCDARAGQGSAEITFSPDAPVRKTEVAIGGTRGTFVLARRAAYLTLARSFAEEAEVAPDEEAAGEPVTIHVLGEFADAELARAGEVALGGARAKEVPVAIVEELPGGVDGVIGQSFLSRFRTEVQPDRLRLQALSPR